MGIFYTHLRELLHRTRFQIIPPGDTIERSARDQSIAMGAIPVFWGTFKGTTHAMPWSDILDWSAFSVNFTVVHTNLDGPGTDFWPGLEKRLRTLVKSGEADRLSAGVAAVQKRFQWTQDGVLLTMMEQLALRKLGKVPVVHR